MTASTATPTALHALWTSWGADFVDLGGIALPLRFAGAGAEYQAARAGLALADGGDRGLLRVHGGDARDFLQRTLSSDLRKLTAGTWQWSAMLDGKGHWISDLLLRAEGEAILLDCPVERLAALQQRLDMLHFGEDLAWEPVEGARLLLLGPDAPGAAERVLATMQQAEGSALPCFPRPDRGTEAVEILGPVARVQALAEDLRAAGAEPCGWVALDLLRVEGGFPRWGIDFDSEATLPETGEWHRASLAKGCYAGQELVAKIDTYGEAPRQLCRLDFGPNPTPLVGAELRDEEGATVGRVSSWIWSPLAEAAIGFGVIKRRALREDAVLRAISGQEEVMTRWARPAKEADRTPATG